MLLTVFNSWFRLKQALIPELCELSLIKLIIVINLLQAYNVRFRVRNFSYNTMTSKVEVSDLVGHIFDELWQ